MSLIRRSFQIVSRALKLQPEKIFVGKDQDGNYYFEVPVQRYFLGLAQQSKAKRIVIPPSGEQATRSPYSYANEWNSWLQHKRDDPPTLAEIEANQVNREIMSQRVRNLQTPKPAKERKLNAEDGKESQTVESWTDQK